MGAFSFTKQERLHKRKDIQELFEKGSSFYSYPFKVFWRFHQADQPNQILISVSVRNFKRAVDRNLLKRRIREAYRLHKSRLAVNQIQIAFIFTSKEVLSFKEIESKLLLSFGKLERLVRKDESSSPAQNN